DISMAVNTPDVNLEEGIVIGCVYTPPGETSLVAVREETIEASHAFQNPAGGGGSTSYTVSNGDEFILTTVTRMRNQIKHRTRTNYSEGEL
ncbi:hypothetical protein KO361_05880, partial [Candidatus Woesearchaeota archaeon]|nr:hypothetical protein [Candidatus Woesearchaeota archaeon]